MSLPSEPLGEITVPSSALVVLDCGYLNLWCHDRRPSIPEGALPPETAAAANAAIDVRIEGPDAEKAGRAYDRQGNPFYLFDLQPQHLGEHEKTFDECLRTHGLDARLVPLGRRVPHRERVDLAVAACGGAGEVIFHGIWATAVGGLPRDRALAVRGERMPAGPDEARWRRVWIEVRPDAAIARSELAAHAAVDYARLLFADADALGAWRHDEPLDGKADYVFWGRDAAQTAAALNVPRLSDEHFGWKDLPLDQAMERGLKVQEHRDGNELRFATDFRPHSHHWHLLEQVRSSPTESGVVEAGGARLCGFMTTWGDGVFEVHRDFDAEGQLARVRVELGTPDRVKLMRRVEERWSGPFAKFGLVSRRVWDEGAPVRWLFRQDPDRPDDSGWRIFAGDEDEAYCDEPSHIAVVPLRDLLARDESLEEILRSPAGSAFEREGPEAAFQEVEGPGGDDEHGD